MFWIFISCTLSFVSQISQVAQYEYTRTSNHLFKNLHLAAANQVTHLKVAFAHASSDEKMKSCD